MTDMGYNKDTQAETSDDRDYIQDRASDAQRRLADLKDKKEQMEAAKRDLDEKLDRSRNEIDEMKRDVALLNNLDSSQYQQVEQELKSDRSEAE